MKTRILLTGLAFLAMVAGAQADVIDPATLHIGPGTGLDPVQLTSNTDFVTITDVSNNGAVFANPVLLILAIPNAGSGFTAPTIASVSSGSGQLGGTNVFGGAWNIASGFAGAMTSGGEVYSTIGLDGPHDMSNSFTNYAPAESTINGITASSFGIFVYELTVTGFTNSSNTLTVNFAADLDPGIFVVSYGKVFGTQHTFIYDTPWTNAGLTTTTVPEPTTMLLLGAGLAALGLYRRNAKKC